MPFKFSYTRTLSPKAKMNLCTLY